MPLDCDLLMASLSPHWAENPLHILCDSPFLASPTRKTLLSLFSFQRFISFLFETFEKCWKYWKFWKCSDSQLRFLFVFALSIYKKSASDNCLSVDFLLLSPFLFSEKKSSCRIFFAFFLRTRVNSCYFPITHQCCRLSKGEARIIWPLSPSPLLTARFPFALLLVWLRFQPVFVVGIHPHFHFWDR